MDKPAVLFTPDQIAARIRQIGSEVGRDFDGKEVCVVGLIKSCMVFMADLVRAIPLDMTCHFLEASSLREHAGTSILRTDTEVPIFELQTESDQIETTKLESTLAAAHKYARPEASALLIVGDRSKIEAGLREAVPSVNTGVVRLL